MYYIRATANAQLSMAVLRKEVVLCLNFLTTGEYKKKKSNN